jgi:N-acetylated-alpha-linked acidic dipeptidase
MRRFGDPEYQAHAAAGTLAALFLARMANADIVPFDYRAYANHLLRTVSRMEESARRAGRPLDVTGLAEAIRELGAAGDRWNSVAGQVVTGKVAASRIAVANAHVRKVERALTRSSGLADRPWMRNLIFASDRDNGYSNIAFPSIVEAWQDRNDPATAAEMADVIGRLKDAAGHLDQALSAVSSK